MVIRATDTDEKILKFIQDKLTDLKFQQKDKSDQFILKINESQ